MANEIIAMERGNGAFSFHFYYAIPAPVRVEIGGTGTTGKYPVLTPTSGMNATLLEVLTLAEKDALDAGEAVLIAKQIAIPAGTTDPQLLGLVRDVYSRTQQEALDQYTHRFKYIGRRFDKS